jgi:hypothetical protein
MHLQIIISITLSYSRLDSNWTWCVLQCVAITDARCTHGLGIQHLGQRQAVFKVICYIEELPELQSTENVPHYWGMITFEEMRIQQRPEMQPMPIPYPGMHE